MFKISCEKGCQTPGFINRTPRGRIVTPKAYEHLQIPYQKELFTD